MSDRSVMPETEVIELLQRALALLYGGNLPEAEALAEKVLAVDSRQADAHHLLGLVAFQHGQTDQAVQRLTRAVELCPENIEAHFNRGCVYNAIELQQEALNDFETVIRLNPNHADAAFHQANLLWALGRCEEALAACKRVTLLKPAHAAAHFNLGNMLRETGRPEEALEAYRQATRIDPRYVDAHYNLASLYRDTDRPEQALAGYDMALACDPSLVIAHIDRGNVLLNLRRGHEALAAYDRAIALDVNNATAFYNRGNILVGLAYLDKAEESFRHALALNPAYSKAHSNLIFLHAAGALLSPQAMLQEQREWDLMHGREGRIHPISVRAVEKNRGDRLRVGYVSPDFRTHAVSYFYEPLIAAHDRSQFEIFCYASHNEALSDDTTARLQEYAEHWRFVEDMSDEQLARLINTDNVDILVDLAGHTNGNRLKAFTYRPAPVQVSYLGYLAGTGLEAMDYWLTDEILHPADSVEEAVETIYRLPRCWVCYRPPASAPPVSERPAVGERVVFGSFNALSKLTPAVIETWSHILHALPKSRLLIMDRLLVESETRQMLLRRFSEHGVAEARLLLTEGAPLSKYLATYGKVDVALDPFPRTGGTTTAEALWMGVPVVTLAGDRYAGRISASKLAALGLEDLITTSREEYINKAISLARDPAARARLRRTLRDHMALSPLCDAESLAKEIENAYRRMFENFLRNSA